LLLVLILASGCITAMAQTSFTLSKRLALNL
jgi:hypothetical protein